MPGKGSESEVATASGEEKWLQLLLPPIVQPGRSRRQQCIARRSRAAVHVHSGAAAHVKGT